MNVNISGRHLEITPAIREYINEKLDRIVRHHDGIMGVHIILAVDKLNHKVEADVHLKGKNLFVEATDENMYAAIDALADKLDRQILKHKEKHESRHGDALKHQAHATADDLDEEVVA